jgi:hypothetical protein
LRKLRTFLSRGLVAEKESSQLSSSAFESQNLLTGWKVIKAEKIKNKNFNFLFSLSNIASVSNKKLLG